MNYSIGSVADLISGRKTDNKPSVTTKPFHLSKRVEEPTQKETLKNKQNKNSAVQANTNKAKNRKRKRSTDYKLGKIKKFKGTQSESASNVSQPDDRNVKDNEISEEEKARTVFVGNVSIDVTTQQLKKYFSKYGKVESARLRGSTPSDPKNSKRLTVITKQFNPKRKTLNCYIKFYDKESAAKALEANGIKYKDHFIRVQLSDKTQEPEMGKGIFIGNLPFDAEDDELWEAFSPCGPISSVRIIRDQFSGMGKGFGYVNFQSADAVELSLEMENVTIRNKVLRIKRLQKNQKGKSIKKEVTKPMNRWRTRDKSGKQKGQVDVKNQTAPAVGNLEFQGTSAKNKKKKTKSKKLSKEAVKKLKISKMLAPKATKA